MPSDACSCGAHRVFVGPRIPGPGSVRVCLRCDSPDIRTPDGRGFPQGFDPATWEINQRRRERGEVV